MIHSKNQIIRSMKSYEVGGSTETCGPGRGCKQSKAAAKNKKQKTLRNIKEGVGKVAGILGAGILGVGAYYGNKLLKEQRNGGSVKRKK